MNESDVPCELDQVIAKISLKITVLYFYYAFLFSYFDSNILFS